MKISKLLKFLLMSAMPLYATDDEGGGAAVNEDTGEALGTGNDARVSMLDRIADSADREREEEFADIVDADKGITEKFVAPALDDPEAEQQRIDAEAEQVRAKAAEDAEAAAAGQTPVLPTIKVNGQEVQLTPELIEKAQKIGSADVYLAEAARKKNEAAAVRTEVAPPTQEVDLRDLARSLQMGTEEEAVAALQKLTKVGPSQDDITRTIDDRLSFTTAISKFQEEYKDIVADPVLLALAETADNQLRAKGDTRGYYDRFAAIGSDLRKWVSSKTAASGTQQAEAEASADKVARKAAATKSLPVAGVKTATSVQEEKEESPSEIIARMAASRGGPQWMAGAPKG